jgi:hypothetical protein
VVANSAGAAVLWTENAENGTAYVIDGTSTAYSLIQSDSVSEGAYAFHLANPSFQTNWFEIDRDLAIGADTQLFFQSRLGWATSSQSAQVQLSTNGGATWPVNVYSQSGTNTSGEGAFNLRQVDLGSYANQQVRIRFSYEFSSGSAFTQTDVDVGWLVDDIQIADQLEKSQYVIGNPTAYEQSYLELVNRARADALAEAQRLAAQTDRDILSSYSFFGISPANIVNQYSWHIDNGYIDRHAQPLSFNEALLRAAQLHTQDLFDNQFQGHTSSANPPAPFAPNATLGGRLNAVGYSGAAGENVFSYADSTIQGHAGFAVDWGNTTNASAAGYNSAFAGQGMQNPPGHRFNIHDGSFKEAGIGVINGTNGSVGPQLVTQDFGNPGSVTFVTGVVFEDLNANQFYDIGEGRPGIRIDVDGSGFFAISTDSGGYSVPVSGDGQYEVSFTGGGYAPFQTTASVQNGRNVKVDYLVAAMVFAEADFDQDGDVDGADLASWSADFPGTGSDADGDGDTDGVDFLYWQRQFGQTTNHIPALAEVPEPTAYLLASLAWLPLVSRRQWREIS